MIVRHGDVEIDDSLLRIDLQLVRTWLADSYWSPGISQQVVDRAARNSAMVIGAYLAGRQVGFTRVVSDKTTFAYLCDVIVDSDHRGNGIGRAMVRFALDHPDFQVLRKWILATRDAHGVYQSVGFEPLDHPERWMIHRPGTGQSM